METWQIMALVGGLLSLGVLFATGAHRRLGPHWVRNIAITLAIIVALVLLYPYLPDGMMRNFRP